MLSGSLRPLWVVALCLWTVCPWTMFWNSATCTVYLLLRVKVWERQWSETDVALGLICCQCNILDPILNEPSTCSHLSSYLCTLHSEPGTEIPHTWQVDFNFRTACASLLHHRQKKWSPHSKQRLHFQNMTVSIQDTRPCPFNGKHKDILTISLICDTYLLIHFQIHKKCTDIVATRTLKRPRSPLWQINRVVTVATEGAKTSMCLLAVMLAVAHAARQDPVGEIRRACGGFRDDFENTWVIIQLKC